MKILQFNHEHHLWGLNRIDKTLIDGKEEEMLFVVYATAKAFSEKGTKGEVVIQSEPYGVAPPKEGWQACGAVRPMVEGEFELDGLIVKRIPAHIKITLKDASCLFCRAADSAAYSRVNEALLCKKCGKDNGDIQSKRNQ